MSESIGEMLREARHNKRASLEDASRATKVKVEILEKLEADDFNGLVSPMYTKGFLKLYADYLGMDTQSVVDAYVKSQGGLRRQGLTIETEASVRAKRRPELKLPLRSVVMVVGVLTAGVLLIVAGRATWSHWKNRKTQPVAVKAPATLPKADFDAIYQPATKPAPEMLETPAAK